MAREAIKKLEDEMKANASNGYIKYVGDELIKLIKDNPENDKLILVKGKTIKGSLDIMRKKAQKIKDGNVACLSPDEGMKIIKDYYGIKDNEKAKAKYIQISIEDLI